MTIALYRPVGAALLFLAVLLSGLPATAQTRGAAPKDPETMAQIRAWNAECLECHTESALRKPPREGMDLGKLAKALTDPVLYDQSNHAGMACKTCHLGSYREYPHKGPQPAETIACDECHAQKQFRVDAQVANSAHSKNLKAKFTCSTCHNAHVYATAARLADPAKVVAQDNRMCMECHDSDRKFAEFGGTLTPEKKRPDLDKLHDWLPNAKRHWDAVRCIECHTPPSTVRSLEISHEILKKDKAQRDCVTCHTRDTALRTRLYRHVAETETAQLGFLNSAILGSAYVIGATRNTYLDLFGLGLVGLTMAGVGGHGLIRILGALRRRRDK
jgi:hypothetical protein